MTDRATSTPTAIYVLFAAAGSLVIGSFLPWIKILAPFVGTITKSGIEGGDGWVTVAGGIGLAVLGAMSLNGARMAPRWAIGVSALVGAFVAWEFHDVAQRFASIDSKLIASSFGVGLYLCALGAGAGLIGAILAAEHLDDVAEMRTDTGAAEAGMMCPHGHESPTGARFCIACGSSTLEAF